ncbi:MAG: hypothetical protein ACREOE_15030, partial [Gemmatimonadales bacterium]
MSRRLWSLVAGVAVAAGLAAALLVSTGDQAPKLEPFSLPALGASGLVQVPVVQGGQRLPVVLTFFAS